MATGTLKPLGIAEGGAVHELAQALRPLAWMIVFMIVWGLTLYQIWHWLCVAARPV